MRSETSQISQLSEEIGHRHTPVTIHVVLESKSGAQT